jgi:hypothetical protein
MNLFSISNVFADKTKINFSKKKPVIASRVSNAGVAYGVLGPTQSRTSFQVAEYNLGEISKVMDIESYVRQAFNKHVELCMKEGYDISSRDEEATKYIKRRLKEIAEVSGLTFDMILRSTVQNLVAYSNAFMVKVRDFSRSSGMPITRIAGPTLPPVAAYFPMDPTSMRIKRDFHGKVLKYWQRVPGNPIMPQFIPENIIHIYYDKKEGFAFGTPYIVPALDDIRSLRRMEENVEMLLTQHLFPLYQYIVGTETAPAEIYEDGTSEVDVIKNQIEKMPTEGSIVTPERHEIRNLGAEGKALDASNYLKYFERRVLAGLGVSDVALGRGDTSNRATATTVDKAMTDRCKDFQDVVETFINEYMFKELLYEGGFIIDETEDTFVKLKFREIDIDFMLKVQNHSVFKYEHHAITETEMREEISRDPVSEEQRGEMYAEVVQQPTLEAETESAMKIAGAKAVERSRIMTASGLGKGAAGKKSTNNRQKPTNQHGTKPARTAAKKDYEKLAAMLDHLWHVTKLDIVDMVNDQDSWKNATPEKFKPIILLTYDAINKQVAGLNIDQNQFDSKIKGVFADLSDLLCRSINNTDLKGELVYKISGVFESLRFKLNDLSESVIIEQEEPNVSDS